MARSGQLQDELVTTAVRLASAHMPLSIPSLRSVARECGVSPAAVYRHFPSQSALNRAILLSIDESFVAALTAADAASSPPAQRLHALAQAYLDWGLANPGLYQLRFESADRLGEDFARTESAVDLLAAIDALVRGAGCESTATAEDLWAGLHGVVSLRLHKRDREWETSASAQVTKLLQAWGIPARQIL